MNIIVASCGSKSLEVLRASVQAYAPEVKLLVHTNSRTNFGTAYNDALDRYLGEEEAVIISNDDIVLTPDSIPLLLQDVAALQKQVGESLGPVTARSDNARPWQNIRYPKDPLDQLAGGKWVSEAEVRETFWLSPIFTWVPRAAFEAARFPPLNWYSDDVWCTDLKKAGFRFFISRAYVHHAGSLTVGRDEEALAKEAAPWLLKNRPELAREWGLTELSERK